MDDRVGDRSGGIKREPGGARGKGVQNFVLELAYVTRRDRLDFTGTHSLVPRAMVSQLSVLEP